MSKTTAVSVVVLNWNGIDIIGKCLDSLDTQSLKPHIIVVENGSSDGSVEYLQKKYPDVELLLQNKNLGFAGGVNVGIKKAFGRKDQYVTLLNNDAVVDKQWLEKLVSTMESDEKIGIATSKILKSDGKQLDSTGDFYTTWGAPFPRGRDESKVNKYDGDWDVFAASGGASIYRVEMLKEIGLFDEDFFAYYEDVDISFRAQLAGWKVCYQPSAIVYHAIGASSGKVKGFASYQTFKNYPWLLWKNVPTRLLPVVLPRFMILYLSILAKALTRGQVIPVTKGVLMSLLLMPKKLSQRHKIQSSSKVSSQYIASQLVYDLPPNADSLRKLRGFFRKFFVWRKWHKKP